MNRTKLLLHLALGISFLYSCQKDADHLQTTPDTNNKAIYNSPKTEQEALQLVALGLLKSSQKDKMFTSNLSKLSTERFDGDFDYLAVKLYDGTELRTTEQSVSSSVKESLVDILGEKSSNILNEIAEKYPLINIYTPFSEKDFLSAEDFLIVVDDISARDGSGYPLYAFNKNGEKVKLSSNEEPKLPYIVVGRNERVTISKNNELRSSLSNTTSFYKNNSHSFFLKDGFAPKNGLRASLDDMEDDPFLDDYDFFEDNNRYRDINDKETYDYISQAQFMSKSALQRVESWSRGQPEVALTIFFDSTTSKSSETQIFENKYKLNIHLGEKGWYNGSRSWLKPGKFTVRNNTIGWYTTRWSPIAKPTQMRYYFVEEDGEYDVTISYKKFSISFNLSGKADFIGETVVDFTDPLPQEYPMGNTFKFTLELKKR